MAVQFRPQNVPSDGDLADLNRRNDPLRFERSLEGELIVTPPTGSETGYQNSELIRQLANWNLEHGHGKVLESSTGVLIGEFNGAPDAGWLNGAGWKTVPVTQRSKFLPIPPDVVFELMSPSDTITAVTKRVREWIALGVVLAFVLDPNERIAIPHDKLGVGAPLKEIRVAKGGLPGADSDLVLDLAAIFDAAK